MSKITQKQLKEILNYDPNTGIFTWKITKGARAKAGMIAGFNHNSHRGNTPYIMIGISKKYYLAHRLAFLYMLNRLPKCVDHIDKNGSNNKWNNLREATYFQNNGNITKRKINKSGYKGVILKEKDNRIRPYFSSIKHNYKQISLGYYDTPEEAARAYDRKAIELFGEFANTNFPRSDYVSD